MIKIKLSRWENFDVYHYLAGMLNVTSAAMIKPWYMIPWSPLASSSPAGHMPQPIPNMTDASNARVALPTILTYIISHSLIVLTPGPCYITTHVTPYVGPGPVSANKLCLSHVIVICDQCPGGLLATLGCYDIISSSAPYVEILDSWIHVDLGR